MQHQLKLSTTLKNNQNFPCPITSFTQLRYRVQTSPTKTSCTPLTGEDISLKKKLYKEYRNTQNLKQLLSHLQESTTSTHKQHPTREHRRQTHRRRKKKKRHYSSSSDSTSSDNNSTSAESSS